MPADVGYDKKRSENHDIYWRESQSGPISVLAGGDLLVTAVNKPILGQRSVGNIHSERFGQE